MTLFSSSSRRRPGSMDRGMRDDRNLPSQWIPAFAGMTNEARHDEGFTLLEVLVSFAIVGLVVAIVVPSTIMARQRLNNAEQSWQAQQMVQSLIETMVRSGKPVDSRTMGNWQVRGALTYVDQRTRAAVRLARVSATLTSLDNLQAEPVTGSSMRLVPVPNTTDQ